MTIKLYMYTSVWLYGSLFTFVIVFTDENAVMAKKSG